MLTLLPNQQDTACVVLWSGNGGQIITIVIQKSNLQKIIIVKLT